jgi:RimJ/RimL family protein N-acetyltransferase/GNAT superfamily N-acetyltransferase
MDLSRVSLQPADPTIHFAAIAALMTSQETEPTTESSLLDWYTRQLELGIQFTVAVDPDGSVHGFNGIYRENLNRDRLYGIYLIVEPDSRGCGLGSLLFDDLMIHSARLGARTLRIRVRDNSDVGIRFITHRGFTQKKHSVEMMFDLSTWDEHRYEEILQAVQAQGFRFTNMAELGDTQDNRRKLYALNSAAAASDPGSDGTPPWASFDDFEKNVCNTYWYHPDGQMIAIDSNNGAWAAMSAITVFAGADHANNLFTGTNVRYRGRKLAQAVKTLALRKARTYGVGMVRTSHNSENVAMIAIDTKLGYKFTPGTFTLEKELTHA